LSPFALIILALPILEIAVFILVGGQIGVLPTIGLVVLASIAGGILLRIQGFGALRRIQRDMEEQRDPGREIAHGAMIMLAGFLLLIPGFVTDIVGLLLFIPFVRDVAWRFLRTRMTVIMPFSFDFPGRQSGERHPGKTIDLGDDDYSRQPDPKSPWRLTGRD